MKLGTIGLDGFHTLLKDIADINEQIRFVVPVLDILENIGWAPAVLELTLFITGLNFSQARKETTVAYHTACSSVVGVPVVQHIADHDIRLVFAQ